MTASPGVTELRAWLEPRLDHYLELLGRLVAADDLPSSRAALIEHLGAPTWEHDGHLVYGDDGPLLGCHYDTVWAPGTASDRPFTIAEGRACGPGTADMKAGIVVAVAARDALAALRPDAASTLSLTPDEEDGNRHTRPDIERLALRAGSMLVLECALADGGLKTARKGLAEVRVVVHGRSAHAGNDHVGAANAVVEAAHVAVRAAALHDPAAATVNVGVFRGGERRNVVPDRAEVVLDVRAWDVAAIQAVVDALRGAAVTVPDTRVEVSGEIHRPPMPRTEAIGRLFGLAEAIGRDLGLELIEAAVGGGSEANLAAGVGVPVLDGLGPVGGGSHALSEHVLVDSIVPRAALLAALIDQVGSRP